MTEENAASIASLQESIGIEFGDADLLATALTHSSYLHECISQDRDDNQRLEFLGDAILDFVVGEWLYVNHPEAREGTLTSMRAHVVRTEGLARLARRIRLGDHLLLGKGEDSSGGRDRCANLCAAFEALVGAIYLDKGMSVTRDWVNDLLDTVEDGLDADLATKDAKSMLQEYTQGAMHVTPKYRIVRVHGPDHAREFTAEVLVRNETWGKGSGASKQAAQRAAALDALTNLPQHSNP